MTNPETGPNSPDRLVPDEDFLTPPNIKPEYQIGSSAVNDSGILLSFYGLKMPEGLGGMRVEAYCGNIPSGSYFPQWIEKIGDGSFNKGILIIMSDYYDNVTREMVRKGVAENRCWFASLDCYRKISE